MSALWLALPLLSGLTFPWSTWPMSSLSLCRAEGAVTAKGSEEGSPSHRYVLREQREQGNEQV